MLRKHSLSLVLTALFLFVAGSAMAATSVSWNTIPGGNTVPAGTVVAPTGNASASGSTGGTGLDLMLVIDVSGSMGGSGITNAKSAAIALIDSLPDNTTQVGVVRFNSVASTAAVLQDLTSNKDVLKAAVNGLSAGGGTNIGNGINLATSHLTGANAIDSHAKMQVVISDGYSSSGYDAAAASAATQGIAVHSVGIPGHNASQMQSIATNGNGVYTNVSDLSQLTSLFDGTGGNLVGIDHVDIELANGNWIYDIALDGVGNFVLPDQIIAQGVNTFTAHAYGDDGSSATAVLTLNGTGGNNGGNNNPVPEPSTMLLFGAGLGSLLAVRRKSYKS